MEKYWQSQKNSSEYSRDLLINDSEFIMFFFETRKLCSRKNEMGLLGDFAKGFVIMTVVFWIFAIIELIYIKQIALGLLLLIGLIIPLSMIAFEYLRDRKKERA